MSVCPPVLIAMQHASRLFTCPLMTAFTYKALNLPTTAAVVRAWCVMHRKRGQNNKKFELILKRRAKAYSSSGTVV